jgi:hypothetical protein
MKTICSKCGLNPPYNQYSNQCIECRKKYNYEWRKKKGITEHEKQKCLLYYYGNKDKISVKMKEWKKNNPEKIKQYRLNPSPTRKKRNRIYTLIHSILNNKGIKKNCKSEKLLGYKVNDLKIHLDKYSEDWSGLHIDHKIPVNWFKKDTPLNIICHLDNLHLVKSRYNLIKQDKWCDIPSKEYLELAKPYLKI